MVILFSTINQQRMEQKNRIEGKNSSLNDSRLERLQTIGFRWAKRKGQASWDEKFVSYLRCGVLRALFSWTIIAHTSASQNELVQYKARHGNCHVPTKYKTNTALGRWVSTQRSEYKKFSEGQTKTAMTEEKVRRLESIGFAWFMALWFGVRTVYVMPEAIKCVLRHPNVQLKKLNIHIPSLMSVIEWRLGAFVLGGDDVS